MVDKRVTVLLWLYHHDLWPEFLKLLSPLDQYIKLEIGLYYQHDSKKIEYDAIHYFTDVRVKYYNNYGADIPSFLDQLQRVDTDFFIKIHSKKSMWGIKMAISWRAILLHDLIGSVDIFQSNLKKISNHQNIGIISNQHLLLDNREYGNTTKIKELCNIIQLSYDKVSQSNFPAGNMFLGRTSIYKKYFNNLTVPIIDKKLSKETGKVNDLNNGTFSHSLERIFGYIVKAEDYTFSHPDHKSIKILNDKAPNGYFNLVKLYNNGCYLQEDLNMDGKIILNNEKEMVIEWRYLNPIIQQKYLKLDHSTLIRDTNSPSKII